MLLSGARKKMKMECVESKSYVIPAKAGIQPAHYYQNQIRPELIVVQMLLMIKVKILKLDSGSSPE